MANMDGRRDDEGTDVAGTHGAGGGAFAAGDPLHTSRPGGRRKLSPIEEFYNHMMSPLDMNDPYVHSLIQGTSNAAGTAASNRGIQGPMSVSGTQYQVAGALNNTQMQRQGMGLQAYGLMQGDKRIAEDRYKTDLEQYNKMREQQAAQEAGGGQMIGSVLGGIGGAALGSLAGPMGTMAGAQAGAAFGGGVGSWLGGGGSYGQNAGRAPSRGNF